MGHEEIIGWSQLVIACFVFIVSGLAAVWRVSWVVQDLIKDIKADFNAKLEALEEQESQKHGRIYQRFDEYKDFVESTFVRRDVCGVMHTSTASAVESLTKRIDSLDKKIDELKTLIMSQNE